MSDLGVAGALSLDGILIKCVVTVDYPTDTSIVIHMCAEW